MRLIMKRLNFRHPLYAVVMILIAGGTYFFQHSNHQSSIRTDSTQRASEPRSHRGIQNEKNSINKQGFGVESRNLSHRECQQMLPNGKAPHFDNTAYSETTQNLCFTTFTTLFSGKTRTPLWSAEYLDQSIIAGSESIKRVDAFHMEGQLPKSWQSKNSDYVRSGFDKGHLAPSGDMPTMDSQHESFSLSNMAPQQPELNRGPWAHLEESVRSQAQLNPVYVVTGVLFEGQKIGFLKGRVAIPSLFYKLVYEPNHQRASVFSAANRQGGVIEEETVNQFQKNHGVDFGIGPVSTLNLGK